MGTKPYTEVQSHFRGNESSLFSSSRVSMRIRWEFLLLSAVPSERWPPFITPEQCRSFAVSLQDQAHTMLLPTPSLISVTFAPPCFKSVILAWQHKTAEIKEMWLRQTGSNHGVLSQTSYVTLGMPFNSLNISTLLCEDGNTVPFCRGYENYMICYNKMHSPLPSI